MIRIRKLTHRRGRGRGTDRPRRLRRRSGGGGGGKSGPVEVVTHNAVGGGSDVFTRQMIKVMYENKIIDTNWPVRNVPAGDSIGAMSYMVERKGNAGLIAQVTPTWLATPMTVANATGQPRGPDADHAGRHRTAGDRHERQVAVQLVRRLRRCRQGRPDTLVQAGGSSTANDALTRLVLQDTLGARWKFLSFEDTGSRITALLRDDANIMLGSAVRRRRAGEGRGAQGDRGDRRPASRRLPRRQHHPGAGHRLGEGAGAVPCRDGCARHA